MKILTIVPAFNEALNIQSVIREIQSCQIKADVVVVNDGSTDQTAKAARDAGAVVLSLPFNLGIGGAVQTGFRYAQENGYDVAVQIDGDGQHIAAEMASLLPVLSTGDVDVVIGSRFLNNSHYKIPLARMIGIRCFSMLNSRILKQKITDNTSGFRAYNRKAICFLARNYPLDYPEPEAVVILKKHGFRLREVSVQMRERKHGASSIGALRAIYYMLKVNLAILIDLLKEKEKVEPL